MFLVPTRITSYTRVIIDNSDVHQHKSKLFFFETNKGKINSKFFYSLFVAYLNDRKWYCFNSKNYKWLSNILLKVLSFWSSLFEL